VPDVACGWFPGVARQLDAEVFEGCAKTVAVIAAVGDQLLGGRQRVDQQASALVVAHLSLVQQQDQRAPVPVAHRMELGVQAVFGASDAARTPFFCNRLADVRCALRWVASMMIRSGGPDSSASEAKMRAKTPLRVQRT